jgi:hypothetical protein
MIADSSMNESIIMQTNYPTELTSSSSYSLIELLDESSCGNAVFDIFEKMHADVEDLLAKGHKDSNNIYEASI